MRRSTILENVENGGRGEGRTCLIENTTIYNNYLYCTKNSEETIAKATESR